jgi:hypothetical protein
VGSRESFIEEGGSPFEVKGIVPMSKRRKTKEHLVEVDAAIDFAE